MQEKLFIDQKKLEYVAELSKLRLAEDKKPEMLEDFNNILGFLNELNEVNTENAKAVTHLFGLVNVFRDDVVVKEFSREELAVNAKRIQDGCIKVPQTFE